MQYRRHHLKRLLLIFLILSLGAGIVLLKERTYEWVFIYYMSYDNDLSRYAETILRDQKKGIINSKIAVVVQADYADRTGMKRIALYPSLGKPRRKEIYLESENSADLAELKKYFRWVQAKWTARNYCIVFLNHGGRLNDMCRDDRPLKNRSGNNASNSRQWLPAAEAGKIVADFNKNVEGKVRLLFLQQCGRATLQNLYNFLDAGEYIMASPVIVGAPNTYYTKTLASVAHDPNMTGDVLAETIIQEDEHYTLYTLINNSELRNLPEKLAPVLKSFERESKLNPPQSCSPIFEYDDEKFYDMKAYFQALDSANNGIARGELDSFLDWCEEHLIVSKAIKGSELSNKSHHFGLSIYVPSNQEQIERYDFLPFHQQTAFRDIFDFGRASK
ncbi:MAG: hypothetical protein JXM79_07960 [Sedimentisphaerales bacterium]|nr:hypothetical protein [Sedimentisphaerales bacterium]